MIWSAVLVHLKGRAASFQTLTHSSSVVLRSSSEQKTPRSRQRRSGRWCRAVRSRNHGARALRAASAATARSAPAPGSAVTAHTDPLTRTTWPLGLLAIADGAVVTTHLPRFDEALQDLPDDVRHALLTSSSRLGVTLARPLSQAVLSAAAPFAAHTALAVAHYVTHPRQPLGEPETHPLSDATLADMAAHTTAAWPARPALTARMTNAPHPGHSCRTQSARPPHPATGRGTPPRPRRSRSRHCPQVPV